MIEFRFHFQEDTYVVWLATINRYLQLKEPAFRVFKQWAAGDEKGDIARAFAEQYLIPEEDSTRFVGEISGQIQALFEASHQEPGVKSTGNKYLPGPEYFSDHTYLIGNHTFRFIYRNEYLENLFHPLFCHQEMALSAEIPTCFELYNNGDQDAFRVNTSAAHFFPVEKIDSFQGAVLMEILNVIHHTNTAYWMGVLHASAVTDGRSAVIFTAPSGSGKSSIALLMMANGFNILSDDFVPIAMSVPEIYHFPAGISVKKGAIPLLQEYLPQLNVKHHPESQETEIYLPPGSETGILTNVRAKAIVFIKYDPSTEYELTQESNLEVMNHFIKQSWIAGTPEAAERFLTWYFNLPVYTLRYFNNSKAVEGIRKLLG